jgi:hypothetical protein
MENPSIFCHEWHEFSLFHRRANNCMGELFVEDLYHEAPRLFIFFFRHYSACSKGIATRVLRSAAKCCEVLTHSVSNALRQ